MVALRKVNFNQIPKIIPKIPVSIVKHSVLWKKHGFSLCLSYPIVSHDVDSPITLYRVKTMTFINHVNPVLLFGLKSGHDLVIHRQVKTNDIIS